jgi:hypothetical protein
MRRVLVVTLMGGVGLGLVACGDGEELSEEEFLEQANEICAEGEDELVAAFENAFGGDEEPSPEEVGDFADVFEENISGQLDALNDLEGPGDLEDELDPILDDAREVLEEFVPTLRDDPESAFVSEDPFADVNSRLQELGLTECAD